MNRPLEQQFEPDTVKRILKLAEKFAAYPLEDESIHYYALETAGALAAGRLLAALSLGSSLLEMATRRLWLRTIQDAVNGGEPNHKALQDFGEWAGQAAPGHFVDRMVDDLVKKRALRKIEGEKIKAFHKDVQLPIVHGLTRGVAGEVRNSAEFLGQVMGAGLLENTIPGHDFEVWIEDNALMRLEEAAQLLKKLDARFAQGSAA